MFDVKLGTIIALAAGTLLVSACKKDESASTSKDKPAATEKTAKVHCGGVNECKGHGACKGADNACAGQNGCKGKGFVETASEDDCKAKGGTVMAQAGK